jgi:flagellar motility protein MotE (MotC chaperone)
VLRDDEVIHSRSDPVQVLDPSVDLASVELEPAVVAFAAAVWTPDVVQAAVEKLRDASRAAHANLEESLQNLRRQMDAIAAAHKEVDAEHALLAERHEQVTKARSDLFRRHEQIRAQHPKLDAVLKEMAAAVPDLPAPR